MAKRESTTLTDPTKKKPLPEIREDFEYAKNGWASVRDEAADDMKNVVGNPWTDDDLELREGRPTIAPDEMTQYRSQVTSGIQREPRGMKFQPTGFGASTKTAEFYQDKAREIEYRSDASEHYIGAIKDVLQRSYGAWRIGLRYEKPRDLNPEIYIEGFPDPDVVLPDPDIRREHGQDMKFCFVSQEFRVSEFKKKWPGAQVTSFGDFLGRSSLKNWLYDAKKIRVAEYWKVETTKRPLFAAVLVPATFDPATMPTPKPMPLFEDELKRAQEGGIRVLSASQIRTVDYPKVVMRITNGLEVLETKDDWPGKYIPIVLLFGPTFYVREGGEVKRYVASMTRAMKGPWKSYCYACSQELEVLGQVPKAPVIAYAGQLAGFEDDWDESLYVPKTALFAHGRVPGMPEGQEVLPLPQRSQYTSGEYLQAIEIVKEGFRRAIQAAAGANFLPTNAQKLNDKSGVALDKMDQAFADGSIHWVKTYESGIEWGGTIIEDLMDKVYDYEGETGVMDVKGQAKTVPINTNAEDAFSTRGDHLVTVQTMPISDSQFDAVQQFLDGLIQNLQTIALVAGPPAAAYVLSTAIKMRTDLGPQGEELAQALLPPQFQSKDGKPPDPRLAAAMQQVQQLTQQNQALMTELKTGAMKEKIKGELQKQITTLKAMATSADKDKDRVAKMDTEQMWAQIETLKMLIGQVDSMGTLKDSDAERAHDMVERTKDRIHERRLKEDDRAHQRDLADRGVMGKLAVGEQAAALAPRPEA